MNDKPRVSDEQLGDLINEADSNPYPRAAKWSGELLLDLRAARARVQSLERDLRERDERIAELEERCNRYRGSLDSEMHLGMGYHDKYNALREAVRIIRPRRIEHGNVYLQTIKLDAWEQLLVALNDENHVDTLSSETQKDAGGGESLPSCQSTTTDRPAPLPLRTSDEDAKSSVGLLLVRDGVPYRHDGDFTGYCDGLDKGETEGDFDYSQWKLLTDSPADVPYKLAWEASYGELGNVSLSPEDGLYEVIREGDGYVLKRTS